MWFEELTGFAEESPKQVQNNLVVADGILTSKITGKSFTIGSLEIPSLEELRLTDTLANYSDQISLKEVAGEAQAIHEDVSNENALFQVASQFNLLEMVSPQRTPSDGVGIYEHDYTQGPACAMACGAGTIYRNYFVPIDTTTGQCNGIQIDTIKDLGAALGNNDNSLWTMENGYALASYDGLTKISQKLSSCTDAEYKELKGKLRVGIQWNSEVTSSENHQRVSQIYCSALPVAYSNHDSSLWEPFAKLVLEATYEATFYTALKNYQSTGNNKLFLTLVGGGAFGNEFSWIFDAIEKALVKFKNTPLDVAIVSYQHSDPLVQKFIQRVTP